MNSRDTGSPAFLFVVGSSRDNGNAEELAKEAARGLDSPVEWLRLMELQVAPFADTRHDPDPCRPMPAGDEGRLLDATMRATHIVLVTPLYWYSMSSATKLYLDYWSGWMRVPGLNFKQGMASKTLAAITSFSGSDRADVEPLEGSLARVADYFAMSWKGVLVTSSNAPGEVRRDLHALAEAKDFLRQTGDASAVGSA